MRALALLVRRELRKRPGQFVAMVAMALLAGFLANIGLLLVTSYSTNVATKAAAWEAPDAVAILAHLPGYERVTDALRADAGVRRLDTLEGKLALATLFYGDNDLTALAFVYDLDAPVTLGKRTVISWTDVPVADPVWAPAVLEASGNYRLGDALRLNTPTGTTTFHIQAFVEDTYGGTPGYGLFAYGLPADEFAAFAAADFVPVTMLKVDAASASEATDALARVRTQEPAASIPWDINADLMKAGAAMSAGIFSAMLLAFAAVITGVAVVVMRFLLRNAIATELTSLGVLRAQGFTTGAIVGALVGPFALATVLASAAGVGVSYLVLPGVATIMRTQSGITWDVPFSMGTLAASVGGLTAFVVLVAALSARRVRGIPPVVALRGGTATHSFRRTPLPLATTRLPLPAALGAQEAVQRWRQSAVILTTVAIATFAAVFAFGMTSTLVGSPAATIKLMVGEIEDVTVTARPGVDAHALAERLARVPGVAKAFPSLAHGTTVNGTNLVLLVVDDPSAWRDDPVYAGRLPRHDNEVALSAPLAEASGLRVGDMWTVDVPGGQRSFLLTGLASGGRGMGRFAIFPTEAYRQVEPDFRFDKVAVYVAPGTGIGPVVTAIKERMGADVASATDTQQSVLVELSGYLSAVPALAGVVSAFTALVVGLVVGLVVTTMLVQGRRALGVQKAVGFSHAELARQTRWTYLPPVALGAGLGAVAGALGLAPLLQALLRGVGIMKVDAVAEPVQVLGVPLGVVVVAWVVTWIASQRIRRVSAYALVTE